jgi:probable addiction module antidote protein
MLGAPDEPELFLRALGDVAKAKGMTQLSDSTGLNREGLYDTLSEKGNPRFDSLLKILDVMGLRLFVEKKSDGEQES